MKHLAKGSWVEVDGKRFYARSKLEKRYALYLSFLKKKGIIKDYEHEPEIFRFTGLTKGCTTYTPDFKVIDLDGTHHWVETKGYMDAKSATKIKRFAKYYPEETLKIVRSI